MAVHASGIEKENEALKRGIRGREDLLRSVVGEVRQEVSAVMDIFQICDDAEEGSCMALWVGDEGVETQTARGARRRSECGPRRCCCGCTDVQAERARIDQSILASQLIPAPPTRHALTRDRTRSSSNVPASAAIDSSARVAELEAQLAMMREENEKQAAQIIKYKDRFERIKANARAKRDARDG